MIRKLIFTTFLIGSALPGLMHADETDVGQLLASLAVLEAESGPFAESMIPVLEEMGDACPAMDDTAAAADSYQRAQHMVHRSKGVLSSAQLALPDKMGGLTARVNDIEHSTRLQQFRHEVGSFGSTDERAVGSLIEGSTVVTRVVDIQADWITFLYIDALVLM